MNILLSSLYSIQNESLVFVFLMILVIAAYSYTLKLDIHYDYLWGSVRAFVQLMTIGLLLQWIFNFRSPWFSVGVVVLMLLIAPTIVTSRAQKSRFDHLWKLSAISIFLGTALTTIPIWLLVLKIDPWWKPQYFILINSMVIAFCMNGTAQTIERFSSDLKAQKDKVELALALGANPWQAIHPVFRNAVRAPMIPAFHMMLAVGIVQLPGFMTGQITSGALPYEAVKYQFLIIIMMVFSRSVSCILFSLLCYRQFFTPRYQLRRDRMSGS